MGAISEHNSPATAPALAATAAVSAAPAQNWVQPLYGASFLQAVARFWLHWKDYNGKASRSEYWYAQLFYHLVSWVAAIPALVIYVLYLAWIIVAAMAAPELSEREYTPPLMVFAILLQIFSFSMVCMSMFLLVPRLMVTARRLQDAGHHPALTFLTFVPFTEPILTIVVGCLKTAADTDKQNIAAQPVAAQQ